MSGIKLRRWDVVNYLQTDEDIVYFLEAVLEDGPAEHIANSLVNIARAKGLFNTNGETPRGESLLEKAIEDSYRRNPDGAPKEWTLRPPVAESAD